MATDTDSSFSSLLLSAPSSPPSSPLSSLPSNSPSPPPPDAFPMPTRAHLAPYPSPPASQQTSQSGSPVPDGADSSANTDKDGPPPAKRRRISKERTTEYLDLRSGNVNPDHQPQLDRLLNVLHKRQKIVVIAGAGISVSAGIPDFRSSRGLFRSLKEEYNLKGSGKHLFDASVYKDDVSTSSFHEMVSTMSRMTKDAKPTAFHHMLATIAQEERLLRLYSQNVDGIDTALEPLKTAVPLRKKVDGKWPRTVQLHGGLDKMVCSKCRELSELDPELFTGPVPPLCPRCEEINDIRTNHEGKRSHGIGRLRPRMVLYNEHNPDDEAIGAVTKEDLRKRPDAVIVVGTTLKVPGVRRIVREMCATVRDRRGGVTIWINNDTPPVAKDLEDCWDIIVQGASDEVARHAAMRKWNESAVIDEFRVVNEEEAQKATENALQVDLSAKEGSEHAESASLPSDLHKNHSILPPLLGPMPQSSSDSRPEWSSLPTSQSSVIPSIERDVADAKIDAFTHIASTAPSLVLGSSKPQHYVSATKDALEMRFTAIRDKIMDVPSKVGQPTAMGENKGAPVKTKRANVKSTKTPIPKLGQGKSAQQTAKTKRITNTFKPSKTVSLTVKNNKIEPPSPAKSPSKLRQVTNMSATEPIHPLPPQDLRCNVPPTPALEFTKNLSASPSVSENRRGDHERNQMSVLHVLN